MTTDPARFDRVTAHPDYAATANRRIALPYDPVEAILPPLMSSVGIGAVVTLVAIWMVFLVAKGLPLVAAIAFVMVSFFAIRTMRRPFHRTARAMRFHALPIERHVGVVTQTRTHVWTHQGSPAPLHTSTTYFATLQRRDGARTEYETPSRLFGQLSTNDIGVAFTKGHMLVDFTRFDV